MAKFYSCEICGKSFVPEFTIFSFISAVVILCDECRKRKSEEVKAKEEQIRIDEHFDFKKR